MTARPIAVGHRVRARSNHVEGARVGVVVHIGDQTPRQYGEPYSVGVRLDDDAPALGGSVLGYRLSELDRLDDPHTSSAHLTEDPADSIATPCATSATPDPVDPATGPAPEAGAASAHDAAPAPDGLALHDVVLHLGATGLRKVVVDGHDMICPAGSQAVVTYADGSLPAVTFTILAEDVGTLVSASPGAPVTTRGDRRQVGGPR